MKRNNKKFIRALTTTALIAALYTVLTFLSAFFGLSGGAVQLRLSEALCLLPIILPEATIGLTIGCAIANLLTGCTVLDIVFGSLATFIGAFFGKLIYKKLKAPLWVSTLPTVFSNMLIIPPILAITYGAFDSYPLFLLSVGIGEILSAAILGTFLFTEISKALFVK